MNNDFLDLRDYYDPYVGFKTSHERFDEILDDMGLTRDTQDLREELLDAVNDWSLNFIETAFGDPRDSNYILRLVDSNNIFIMNKCGIMDTYAQIWDSTNPYANLFFDIAVELHRLFMEEYVMANYEASL